MHLPKELCTDSILRLARDRGLSILESGDHVVLRRDGALPESDDWSHASATAANTGGSADWRLRPPLDLLWFDGGMRSEWKRGGFVKMRVAGGQVYFLTRRRTSGLLKAMDVYTGRQLWQRKVVVWTSRESVR